MADPGEVGGELVELLLAPRLERVVVALGAFEPDAEEDLADDRRRFLGLSAVSPDRRRPRRGSCCPLAVRIWLDELVVGKVAAEGVANPGVEVEDGLYPDPVRVWSEQVGPLVGPVVGVLGPSRAIGRSAGRACRGRDRQGTPGSHRESGNRPMASRKARRWKVASPAVGPMGTIPSFSSFAQIGGVDHVFDGGARHKPRPGPTPGIGIRRLAVGEQPARNRAETVASPGIGPAVAVAVRDRRRPGSARSTGMWPGG